MYLNDWCRRLNVMLILLYFLKAVQVLVNVNVDCEDEMLLSLLTCAALLYLAYKNTDIWPFNSFSGTMKHFHHFHRSQFAYRKS